MSVSALENLVLALLSNGFAELDATLGEHIGDDQHDRKVGLVIERDCNRIGLLILPRQLGMNRKYQRGGTKRIGFGSAAEL